ncbi:DUF2680 domain-containing protein [Bacillus massiliigorillae]|uniref:DUF2680 domain-containing protein n=1 Tax=Bacillus massiliigorillae TaxID=1243664 RepID=UPI00039E0506|nr:DUF2680 domain-containing protein [Bacillus massiliigorillae]
MNKIIMSFMIATLLSLGFTSLSSAEEQQNVVDQKKVQLTSEQQAEVKAIHQNILEQKKKLIGKYVEFGQMTKEDGDKLISRFDQKFKKMEEMGFQMPKHHHFHKSGKH